MDFKTTLLADLNGEQSEAVAAPLDNLLVLAGAGSGKTRVLVHRIAWLAQVEQIPLHNILAVTFTNKAAAEMKSRISSLLARPPSGLWVGTFHGLAHRLLRAHWQDAGLPKNFQILDADDQLKMIRRVMKDLSLDEKAWPAKTIQWYINSKKDEGLRPQSLDGYEDVTEQTRIKVYQAYEEACSHAGVVDFAELLLRAHELWLQQPQLLAHYQQRFGHILVDEFQDTNTIQYAWIRLLAGTVGKAFIVGDDDQSIYGWRGAQVANIHQFQEDFKQVRLVRLERNYRSTGHILKAANHLITFNFGRLGKNLWTSDDDGSPVQYHQSMNEQTEANFVVETIKAQLQQGAARNDFAVLYRSNVQSRVVEEALVLSGIPYRVYGGLRFFDRAEVKDVLAYARLMSSRADDAALMRVINFPTRGIGERSIALIRQHALSHGVSMWQAAQMMFQQKQFTARTANALQGFFQLMDNMSEAAQTLSLRDTFEQILKHSGLVSHYEQEKSDKGLSRIENMQELVNAAEQFVLELEKISAEVSAYDEVDVSSDDDRLAMFLAYTALESGEQQAEDSDDYVQLMTLHSAKGLEFPTVFMIGMEEGLFPTERSLHDVDRLEEERRLCYVGITRARKQLYMTSVITRRLYGKENHATRSRFIAEIPGENIIEIKARTQISRPDRSWQPKKAQSATINGLQVGQRVSHNKFGYGILLDIDSACANPRVQINFDQEGVKWLVLSYAKLSPA